MSLTHITKNLASVVEASKNDKIGDMSATYTPYSTCPDTCELKPTIQADGNFDVSFCYASSGMVACTMRRIGKTAAAAQATLVQIQEAECNGINALSGKRPLRLKAAGDTPNGDYARALSVAAGNYTAKHGQPAYGYTHNWRAIDRVDFGGISMLASCDAPSDIAAAKERGYATAVVVSEFPNGAKTFKADGHDVVPCPNQVAEAAGRKLTCEQCMLCSKDAMLRAKSLTIGFVAHGTKHSDFQTELRTKGL